MKEKLLLAAAALLGFATACNNEEDQPKVVSMYGVPYNNYKIKGKVTDKAGRPIKGIEVRSNAYLPTPEATTAADGTYDLSGKGVGNTARVTLTDTDGPANGGDFAAKTVDIEFTEAERTAKGDGDWDQGAFAKSGVDNAHEEFGIALYFHYICRVDTLDNDIKFVAGVGEARAKLLERELGIRTLGDMLSHYPFRYIDRTRIYRISEITEAAGLSYVQFRARITGVAYAGTGRKRRFTAFAQDPTGQAELVWFQGVKWIEKRIEVGREYLVFGRPSFYRGELSVAHPELETMEQALSRKAESGMQGIYPSTEKLGNVLGAKGMYQIICNAWTLVKDRIADPLPEAVRTRYGLIGLRDAIYNIHFPQSQEALRQAQYRLKFDELLGVQLNIQQRRTERLAKSNGFLFTRVGGVFNTFYTEKLPFPLTGAQKRVIRDCLLYTTDAADDS